MSENDIYNTITNAAIIEYFIIIPVAFSILTAIVASKKGRDAVGWFIIGLLLGPIGFILSLIVSENKEKVENDSINSFESKRCPFCAEIVRIEAILCKHCGKNLPERNKIKIPNREEKSEWDRKWF